MPGRRFTKKEDRQAQHIADSEGGGKEGLSIGYATINARKKSKKSKRKKSHRRATGKLRTRKKK